MFCGSRRLARPIGERSSISTNECPCKQHNLRCSSLRSSESHTAKDAFVCSLRHMTARCIDRHGDGPISLAAPTPPGPPRSTLAAPVLQRNSSTHFVQDERMQLCEVLTLRSLSAAHPSATPETPCWPQTSAARCTDEGRRERGPLLIPTPAGRSMVADRSHVQNLVPFSTGSPGHQQTVGRYRKRCKRCTFSSLDARFDVIGCISRIAAKIVPCHRCRPVRL